MDITTYQRKVTRTMRTDLSAKETLSMLALGIAGEAGEVIEMIKKDLYHGHLLNKKEISKEIGDLQWYLTNLATYLNLLMENVLDENIEKLEIRYPQYFSCEDSIARVDTK